MQTPAGVLATSAWVPSVPPSPGPSHFLFTLSSLMPMIKMHNTHADDDTSSLLSQSCQHLIDTRRHFDKEHDEVSTTPFGTVFLYSSSGSPCWTESDSQPSSIDLTHSDLILQESWEAADQTVEMTASWSSAATGKPQLSYAERLRKAKEGTAKAEARPPPPSYTDSQAAPQNGAVHHERAQRQQEQQSETPLSANTTPRPTPVQSPPNHNVAVKLESAGDSSATTKTTDPPAAVRPVVNVWEARRKMLQEKAKAKEEGIKSANGPTAEQSLPASNEVSPDRERGNLNTRTTSEVPSSIGKSIGKREEARGKRNKVADSVAKTKIGSSAVPPSTASPSAWHRPTTSGMPTSKKDASKIVVATSPAATAASASTPPSPSTNGTSITATSPSTSSRRLDQKRPTPLPVSSQDEGGKLRPTDAAHASSPSRGMSPRFAKMTLSSPRDHSSSPLRSPSVSSGTIRGPRFSIDANADGAATQASVPQNALQLSNGTSDGSYAPIRASASLFPPAGRPPNLQDGLPLQRSQSSAAAPSPRGSRGRGKMSKTSDGHSVGESSGSRNDTEERGIPSDVPVGPRRQQNGDGTPPRDGSRMGGNYRRGGPYYQPPLPYGMYGVPPPPPGGFYYPPPGPYPLESTPSEFAPQGDAAKSEPSEALLHQIEFYFSHRNLEGDFYLRKNMDSQGFVPIQVVANFNKVKKMTEEIDVIKKTLLFSKVLFVDAERDMVRKAVDWHLYILLDGERPQQNMYHQQHPYHLPTQQMPPPPPHFGQPLPPFAHTSPPFLPAHYGQPGPPPFYFSPPYNQLAAQNPAHAGGNDSLHRPADSPDGHHSNGEASGDNVSEASLMYEVV